ncbi:MAG: sensor histidine kinase, partial [Acetatifactor sp.]|nr:sensor histidine kinase [Acetatifactor sp.]
MGIDMALSYRRYAALQQTLDAVGLELDIDSLQGKKSAGGFRTAEGESHARGDLQTADGECCAWELLQGMLYGQKGNDSERGDWETGIYREMVKQLLLEQRRRQDIMQIRHQDTVDYYTTWVHQIKTPIAAMGLILQQEDTEDSRRLSEELQRIEQYVDMVLTYLRLGSRDTDYVFAQVDLDRLLRGCIKKYAGQFIRRHLILNYQSVDCRVLTDEKWLAFVVEQVLSNALKYTREGSVSIYLEPPCILCIRDTGIGIASEDLPRIFEKGYTGYNGRSDKKATGLGLY